jgi:4-aminobutyrate aminotransferase-like enzyme
MDILEKEALPDRAMKLGQSIFATFEKWQKTIPIIKEWRGLGLMIGLDLKVPSKPIMLECLKRGLIVNAVTGTALRMLPALNIPEQDLNKGLDILYGVLQEASK